MQKDLISSRNAIFLFVVLVISNNIILGFPMDVKQDTWISILLSLVMAVPLILIYARMIKLLPEMDIYEMAEHVFGKVFAKIVGFVFGFFCLHLCSMMIAGYSEFIHLTSLFQTPTIIIVLVLFSACLYMAKSGIGTIGKWCTMIIIISFIVMILISVFSPPHTDINNLKPIFSHSIKDIFTTAGKLIPVTYGEAVIILALLGGLKKDSKPSKIMMIGTAISVVYLLVIFLRTCIVLGADTLESVYFPNYKATSVIQIGNLLERVEALLAFIYILTGIGKIAADLIAASKGTAKVFGISSYKSLISPVGFLACAISLILFNNVVEMFDFINVYLIYALPFQLLIPIVIWIGAEVKAKANKKPLLQQE